MHACTCVHIHVYIWALFYLTAITSHFLLAWLHYIHAYTIAKFSAGCWRVFESSACVAMYILNATSAEYSCCRKCHVNLDNNLQICCKFLSNKFHSRQWENVHETYIASIWGICSLQGLQHRFWSKTAFCELVPSWGAWWRNRLHSHSVCWSSFVSTWWMYWSLSITDFPF